MVPAGPDDRIPIETDNRPDTAVERETETGATDTYGGEGEGHTLLRHTFLPGVLCDLPFGRCASAFRV